ncbi:hypothetical protein HaLaN_12252 [Haematococcus lacustris]|uniref:Uncharacterized protein n=1 Tax=Haematococcus lacustris TaxID=44745 RepID=A0A699Z2Y7_HAELA|nr:hypothetical protein HaLaN_12252 [Haematococcus lacustris]
MRPQVASMRQALAKFHSAPNNPVCQAVRESMEAMRSPTTSTTLQAIHQETEDPFRGWVAPGPRLGGSQLHSPTHQSRALPLLA